MSFSDIVDINLSAGKGGDGHRSFRRERFIRKGGPDGGDGGDGGNIIFKAAANVDTLASFRYDKNLRAGDGQAGGRNRKHGKRGNDLIVNVPVGTQVLSKNKELIADLHSIDQEETVAIGGKGGFGNAHFVSSSRQAPNFAEIGVPGQKLEVTLELKLIADVAIIGLPNAGKSTLLSKLSNARPLIADYPFTTLVPSLGVVDVSGHRSFLMADIPGLIEGASTGKGLGHQFLRHIERTKLVVHLIDAYNDNPAKSYQVIREELASYSVKLTKLPEIVVVNKTDGLNEEKVQSIKAELEKVILKKGKILFISALSGTNLDKLKYALIENLENIKPPKKTVKPKTLPVIKIGEDVHSFNITKDNRGFKVSGQQIDKFASRTDFTNQEAVDRLKDIMRRQGIYHQLVRQGAKPGDKIYFGTSANDYLAF